MPAWGGANVIGPLIGGWLVMRAPWHHRGMVTSAVYATRLLGGSFTIVVVDLVHGGFPLRFALVAAIAGVAALSLSTLSPGRVVTEADITS